MIFNFIKQRCFLHALLYIILNFKKIQYGQEIEKRVTKDVTKNVTKKNESKFSKILLHAGLSIEEISNAMTVLTTDDIQKIAERMNRKSNNRNVVPK